MNFKLEQWEIPSGADAENLSVPIEFGPVEWNGEQTMISARWLELDSGEALAFFHPHCAEINYVVLDDNDGLLYERHKSANSKTLGWRARQGIENSALYCGRLFFCAGEAVVTQNSIYHWSSSSDLYRKVVPLRLPFDSANKTSASIYDWFQTQWNDRNSEVRFSWEWSRKDSGAREQYLGTIVPRWNELHDLMRAVSFVVQLPVGEYWSLYHSDALAHSPELRARLQSWRELLESHFSFEPLAEYYPQFLRDYCGFTFGHIAIEGVDFSAHQQLEARLTLRDWLKRNAPAHLDLIV